MIERVVVNPEGMIIRLELLSPFSYLHHVTKRVLSDGGEDVFEGKQNANSEVGTCSDYVLSDAPGRTRTYGPLFSLPTTTFAASQDCLWSGLYLRHLSRFAYSLYGTSR